MTYYLPCPEWEELLAKSDQDLTPEQSTQRDEHLASCIACATTFADYSFLDLELQKMLPPSIKPLPRLAPLLQKEIVQLEYDYQDVHEQEDSDDRSPLRPLLPRRHTDLRVQKKKQVHGALALMLVVLLLLVGMVSVFQPQVTIPGKGVAEYLQHQGFIFSIVWSPDGKYMASASADSTVRIWEVRTQKEVVVYRGHLFDVLAVAWSPDGNYIVSGGGDRTVQIWEAMTGKIVKSYEFTEDAVSSLSWSPDNDYIAIGTKFNSVEVWDWRNNLKPVKVYNGHYRGVVCVASWSFDGKYIASGARDDTVQIWDALTTEALFSYQEHEAAVNTLIWSPNGAYIASGGDDGTVRLWNWQTGETLLTYYGHQASVMSLDWSPDGQYIASGGLDNTVQVWNVTTGELVYTYRETRGVRTLAWSPDGRYIASGGMDDIVKIWQAPY